MAAESILPTPTGGVNRGSFFGGRASDRGRFLVLAMRLLFALMSVSTASAQEPPAPEVSYYSFFDGWPPETYALDGTERFLEENERLRCDASGLVGYRSASLRYGAHVHPAFVERLERFDRFVAETASAFYGRAPRRLVHRGSYNCRSARGRRGRISEHAFGNALDVQGFDFGPLPRGVEPPSGMPRHLRHGFQLRVRTHWSPRRERDAYHAGFLHFFAEQLKNRPDIFRGIVGPPQQRHLDHLHLDAAPWRYAMFGYDRADEPSR